MLTLTNIITTEQWDHRKNTKMHKLTIAQKPALLKPMGEYVADDFFWEKFIRERMQEYVESVDPQKEPSHVQFFTSEISLIFFIRKAFLIWNDLTHLLTKAFSHTVPHLLLLGFG